MTPQRDDALLDGLLDTILPSEGTPRTAYRLVRRTGDGEVFSSFYAVRSAPEGECPVVVKVLLPSASRRLGPSAAVMVKKEAVSLRRLNERVPPTPFVVQLLDTGTVEVRGTRETLHLPWITIEYVHGGAQGVTLRERVQRSIEATGHAFAPARALRAIECLASGLAAVHEVGVIHRAISPDSIVCSGADEEEILKISDFGLARPQGMEETLGLGFAGVGELPAPEVLGGSKEVGPWTDIFGFACVIYFLLTGELLIDTRGGRDFVTLMESRSRRSILEGRSLHPALRANEAVCRSIDFALRWASAPKAEERLQEAEGLAAMLVPYLRPAAASPLAVEKVQEAEVVEVVAPAPRATGLLSLVDARGAIPGAPAGRWSWATLRHPGTAGALRGVAWDGYGRCLAATPDGLLFWNGMAWCAMDSRSLPRPNGIRFVHKVGPGRWLVGGDASMLAVYTTGGFSGTIQKPGAPEQYTALSGDAEDMGVLAAAPEQGPLLLRAFIGRRWLRPCPVAGVAHIAGMTRVEDERWLLAGDAGGGKGALVLYSPLEWQHERLAAPEVRAFNACAGAPESNLGVAVGTDGAVVWWAGRRVVVESLEPRADLSAVALAADGSAWAAASGQIWRREPAPPGAGAWERVWADAGWRAPVISLFVDFGVVVAVTEDGGILEGRLLS